MLVGSGVPCPGPAGHASQFAELAVVVSTAKGRVVADLSYLGWHVKSVAVAGQPTLTADWSTTAKVRFRRDGIVVVNGNPCGAPHFGTVCDKIALHWSASSDCSDFEGGTKVALHISTALDNLTSRSRLIYALRSGKTLTLVGGRYRAVLQSRPIRFPSPAIGPSSRGPR